MNKIKVGDLVANGCGWSMKGKVIKHPKGFFVGDDNFCFIELQSFHYEGIAVIDRTKAKILKPCPICKEGIEKKDERYCNSCLYWKERISQTPRRKQVQTIEENQSFWFVAKNVYADNNTGKVEECLNLYSAECYVYRDTTYCGSGGRLWTITINGQTVQSNNVWCCGKIPVLWYKAFIHLIAEIGEGK